MKNNRINKKIGIFIVKVAKKIASVEANSTCTLFSYQPNMPDKVKKCVNFKKNKKVGKKC